MAKITRTSPWSGLVHERDIDVDPLAFENWKFYWDLGDASINPLQGAFPHLNRGDREFLFSGITPEEWVLDAINAERAETRRLGPITNPNDFSDEIWESSYGIIQRSKLIDL